MQKSIVFYNGFAQQPSKNVKLSSENGFEGCPVFHFTIQKRSGEFDFGSGLTTVSRFGTIECTASRRELDFVSRLTTVSRFGTIRCTASRRELDFGSDGTAKSQIPGAGAQPSATRPQPDRSPTATRPQPDRSRRTSLCGHILPSLPPLEPYSNSLLRSNPNTTMNKLNDLKLKDNPPKF